MIKKGKLSLALESIGFGFEARGCYGHFFTMRKPVWKQSQNPEKGRAEKITEKLSQILD